MADNSQFFKKYVNSKGSEYDAWQHMLRSKMVIREDRNLWHRSYNRLQFKNHHFALAGTREYLFFTKPDLNIMASPTGNLNSAIKNDAFWVEMKQYYRRIISDLQKSARRPGNEMDAHHFIPLLTNAVSSNLDMPSKEATTTDTSSTIYGTNLQYRKNSMASDENIDFSLEFYDNPWLDVYHFFKMWDAYSELKDLGIIGPPGGDHNNPYRLNKVLHDQIAIFRFIVDADDMSTIIHYSKLTGCFPKSVPREAFGEIKEGLIEYSVSWHANFIDDMNPIILYEFNEICEKFLGGAPSNMRNFIPIYSNKYKEINGDFVKCPYIVAADAPSRSTGMKYKLMWLDKLGENRTEKFE